MNVVPVFAPAQLRASCVPKLPAHEARPQATTSAAGRLHGNRVISGGFVPENREKAPRTPGFPCNHARCVPPGATGSTETNDSKSWWSLTLAGARPCGGAHGTVVLCWRNLMHAGTRRSAPPCARAEASVKDPGDRPPAGARGQPSPSEVELEPPPAIALREERERGQVGGESRARDERVARKITRTHRRV